ncbi:phosphotyrosine-specific ptp2-like protein [Coemansia asiatica]|uniref:protein-tyrosine-phosphatase n=1 Tax=Coemansia asiatica TaxID=1052880 RepID=A0A9W8CKA1_9FUNG|nr:phosphotyrosine-specific ptp2-like protein [Coemansia asiatica]
MRLQLPSQQQVQPRQTAGAASGLDSVKPAEQWDFKAKPSTMAAMAAGGLTASSIAQRRLQRKPMGLHLDISSGATTVGGSDGPPPPPTARGTWTMNAQPPSTPLVLSTPMAPLMPIAPSAPMTPMVSIAPAMMNISQAAVSSGPVTPSEGTEVLGLFCRSGGLSRKPEVRETPCTSVKGLDFISSSELSQLLAQGNNNNSGFLVDVRSSAEYAKGCISTAVNITAPTTLVRRKTFSIERLLEMAGAPEEMALAWKQSTWISIYSSGAPEDTASEDSSLVLLARKFTSEAPRGCRICVLRGGYSDFVCKQRSLCEIKQTSDTSAADKPEPTASLQSVPADHPMLRSMRQAPGGAGFDAADIVHLRLPPSRVINIEGLPPYLRRTTGSPGAQYLHQLFASVDSSESQRMSSMIGSNGMVTAKNTYTIAAGLELGAKNRYNNIYPFDSNRVRLRSTSSDYINASYVSYFNGPLYIATQGPLPATVADFWQMVWEQRVRVIVMLTRVFENGREKCHRYWPQSPGGASAVQHGDLRIEFQAEARHPDDATVISRRLRVSHIGSPDDAIIVTHLQYETWPDHGAPETPLGVLRLRELARIAQGEDNDESKRIPMIVHCSAGCGRTGAFCAVDTVMSMTSKNQTNSIPSVVSAPADMQMLPSGETYDAYAKFTSLVPQALRSKSSNAALAVDADVSSEHKKNNFDGSNSSSSSSSNSSSNTKTDDLRASRSLSRWIDIPNSEFSDDLVFMVVSRFRELRVSMVQTNSQFVFCHEALAWDAMGAGPRPLSRIIDRRLVAEWNRANYPSLGESDYVDLTYQLRGRQEMLQAMLSAADASSSSSAATSEPSSAKGSVSTSSGRASIDVTSATLSAGSRPSVVAPPLVKRSNTVGPARRGLFGSMFSPTDDASSSSSQSPVSAGSRQRAGAVAQGSLVAPPLMKTAFSSDARLGFRSTQKPAAIAEEDETSASADTEVEMDASTTATAADNAIESGPYTDVEQQMEVDPLVGVAYGGIPGISASAAESSEKIAVVDAETAKPHQRFALRRPPGLSLSIPPSTTPAAPTIPLPAIPLPALPTSTRIDRPPSVHASQPEIITDYFGCVQGEISSHSTNNSGSNSGSSNMNNAPADYIYANSSLAMPSAGLGTGMLDVFVGLPTSDAADWRRSVLGHLDASGEFSPIHASHIASGIAISSNTDVSASPTTANTNIDGGARAFATGNPALSSPRVK